MFTSLFTSCAQKHDRALNRVIYAKRVFSPTRVAMGPWRLTKEEAMLDEVELED